MITPAEVWRFLVHGTVDRTLQTVTPSELSVRESFRRQQAGRLGATSRDPLRFRFGRTPGFGRKFA